MCNYAVNSIYFYSRDFTMIHELHSKIYACYTTTDNSKNSIRYFFSRYNYNERFITRMTDSRDYFSHCDKEIECKDSYYMFSFETYTAWSENMEAFFALMADHYKNQVNISFISEEPGGELFIYKDDSGLFCPDRYKVDFCLSDNYCTEYFNNYSSLISYLKKCFAKADISLYDPIKTLEENINKVYGDSSSEYFLNINRFKEYTLADPYIYDTEVA